MARFFIAYQSGVFYDGTMKYAMVTTNLLDLRAEPRFEAERLSQLLFGEVVRTGVVRHGYCRIQQSDGYAGWVDRCFLCTISQRAAHTFQKKACHIVSSWKANLTANDSIYPTPHFVFYGTHLRYIRSRSGIAFCELADGRSIQLNRNHLKPINAIKKEDVVPRMIVREAKRFLGVPYLWGGISPTGFDCSGLVQTIFGRFGINLPRDTKDQIKVGKLIDRTKIKAGDLLFFKCHVALALGRSRILHASVGGSGVRINSLVQGKVDYRADLDRDFVCARRLL